MRNEWLITFRTVTFAQRGEKVLHSRGIPCVMQRTPKKLTERGCGYCLRLRSADAMPAVEILRQEKLAYEKVYALNEDGTTQEWLV